MTAAQRQVDENNLITLIAPSTEAPTTIVADITSSSSANDTLSDGNTTTIGNNATRKRVSLPNFDYTGYFVDETARYSTSLRGFCRWTTSDSLCLGTMVPIILTTIALLVALVYNCAITPQKGALLDPGKVRDSPLFPSSLKALSDDEVNEIVLSSSNLALKDLFPLLGLETLVTRAAALGLATLKDLLCANALAVRDIGVEVKESRILARSLERIASHAKKVVAEKRKNNNRRGRASSITGRASRFASAAFSMFGLGGGDESKANLNNGIHNAGAAANNTRHAAAATNQNAASSSSPSSFPLNETPLLFSQPSFFQDSSAADGNRRRGVSFAAPRERAYTVDNGSFSPRDDNFRAVNSVSSPSAVAAAGGGGYDPRTPSSRNINTNENENDDDDDDDNGNGAQQRQRSGGDRTAGGAPSEAGSGQTRWARLRARLQATAAVNALERLAGDSEVKKSGQINFLDI